MELIVHGKLNNKYFRQVHGQLQKLMPVPDYIEKMVITDHSKHTQKFFKDFPKTVGKQFSHEFEQARTSMAFTHKEIEVILILTSKTNNYIKKNVAACIGTMAHEVTHVLHKKEGLNDYMDKCFEANFKDYYKELAKLKISDKDKSAFAATLGIISSDVLKDLYMIQELVSRGLGDYVLEDYYRQMAKPIKPPIFYKNFKTATRAQILAAINFELSVLTGVLPFEAYPNPKAKKLVQYIHAKYEKNIPEIVREFLALDRLYDEEFSWSWAFQKKFSTEI